MPKFIIRWNSGYGNSFEVVDADDIEDANEKAYSSWHDEVESNADYDAVEYTEENADEAGLEFEE